jgi:predicted HicB family RNase H-like nuclease
MKYKKYYAKIEYDDDSKIFHGRVLRIGDDVVNFEGYSVEELYKAFQDSVDDYVYFCENHRIKESF